MRQGKNLEASQALQSAVKEDPQFALAYSRGSAESYAALGYDTDAEEAFPQAVDSAQQLPLGEKYLIEASHARIVKDTKKAIEAYENLAKTTPDNLDVRFGSGKRLRGWRRPRQGPRRTIGGIESQIPRT